MYTARLRQGTLSVGVLLLAAMAAWLLSPAVTATHPEGFTALIQLDAIAAQSGLLDRADLIYPVQTEYFYLTRQGVVLLLRLLMALSGDSGDGVFRALTLGSDAVFLVCTALVVRRHSRLSWLAIAAGLLLVPGLSELGFYFSDSVVSAGFGMLGLAALPGAATRRAAWIVRGLLAGAALGMAVLARTDSVLLLPLAAGLAWLDCRGWARLAALAALVALGMLAMVALAFAVSGTTPWQAIEIGRFFDGLHQGARSKTIQSSVFILFFGLPGLLMAAIGFVLGLRRERGRRALVLLVLPLPILALGLRSATEVRQIYPLLAPWVVLWCGTGLHWAWTGLLRRTGAAAWAGGAALAATALAWVLPPVFVPVRDGPRAVLGRLWSPPLWRAWQDRVATSLADADATLAQAGHLPRLVVVSAHFNTDHFLQLRAWQAGWRPLRPEEAGVGCTGSVQAWRKDGHELLQLRTEDPYGIAKLSYQYFIALQLDQALGCPAVTSGAPAIVSDFTPPLSDAPLSAGLRAGMPPQPVPRLYFGWPRPVSDQVEAWMERTEKLRVSIPMYYGVSRTAPVSGEQLAQARAQATEALRDSLPGRDGDVLLDFADFSRQFATRFWQPPAERAR